MPYPMISRREMLEEILQDETEKMKACSDGRHNTRPKEGREDEYYTREHRCSIIRDIIQDYENEGVREAVAKWRRDAHLPAAWQRAIMEHPEKAREEAMRF